ncbi:MAG: DUF1614 domain-containing protein [Thermoplasmatales archaeon]|nr:DUF1614 domain-containing protein [Thermoplasmatales archaeon]
MLAVTNLTQIGLWILYISIPIIALYLIYLIITKAFNYMGFTSIEAIIIVFVSFLFGFEIIILDFNISNIYLFSHGNWRLGINMGGAIIPILLSVYLIIKKKISLKNVLFGIIVVSIISFFVTNPVENRGIVAYFPFWLLPAIFASITTIFLSWKNFHKAAPLAYICGTIGVLIGADFLHLPELLSFAPEKVTPAIIGGAVVFDMIFITGIIAVVLDGLIMFRQRSREGVH